MTDDPTFVGQHLVAHQKSPGLDELAAMPEAVTRVDAIPDQYQRRWNAGLRMVLVDIEQAGISRRLPLPQSARPPGSSCTCSRA